MTKRPARLTVELNCIFPAWRCYVTDNKGTANGGFLKRFKCHTDMFAWLARNGYTVPEVSPVSLEA